MCAKKKDRDSSEFLQYLKDELSKQERYKLEKDLQADAFEREAMEGLESISPEKAEEDLLSLHASLNRRLGRRRRRAWYSIAATAASILLVGTIFLNIYDLNPNRAESEPLTEETFRELDSKKEAPEASDSEIVPKAEKKMKAEEPPAAAKDLVQDKAPMAEEPVEVEQQLETGKADEPPAAAKAPALDEAPMAPSAELALEEETYDMILADEEIVAVEAEPERRKRSALNEKIAAPMTNAPQANDIALAGQVSGIVISSEDMEALPGASIKISGTETGTLTDMEGRFTLPAGDKQTSVVASFIGMETEEYLLNREIDNQLLMQPDAVMLDEVVVVTQGSGRLEGIGSSSGSRAVKEEAPPAYSAAEPKEGYKAYRDYVEENMIFPEGYIPGEREIVVLKFTVTSSASISDIIPLRSPGDDYTEEAKRLLLQGPKWKSAILNGVQMDEQVRIRIVFKK